MARSRVIDGRVKLVLAAFLAVLCAAYAGRALAAAPGDLDPTFGGGRVTLPFGAESGAGGVAVAPDGKVVVAGSSSSMPGFTVARLLPNGSPDPSWGGTGVVNTPLGPKAFGASDVAVQSDGKVVAVGEVNNDFGIVRYLENGALDPSFGEGGVVILPVGKLADQPYAVAIGPGGLIAVTGVSTVSEEPRVLGAGVAVLKGNGNPETAFSEDGRTIIQTESGNDDRGEGIAFQADGRILIADATGGGAGDGFTIVRLGTDGKPDPSFGGDGIVETPIPGEGGIKEGRSTDVAIQPDGKIVAGGYGADYTGPEGEKEFLTKFALARYTAAGQLDPSFGSGGIVSVRRGAGDDFGRAVAVAPDGRLILAGTYDHNPAPLEEAAAPALLRFTSDGSLDPSFGNGGIVLGDFPSGIEFESVEGMALQADGRILTSASASGKESNSAVVSRYLFSPPAPPSNAFGFGKVRRNRKAGTAKLAVKVPGPGALVLTGGTVVRRHRAAAGAETVTLLLKAKGSAKRRLLRVGKAKVRAKVTYTPEGGVARTKAKTVKLVKRRR
ncbi:MAG: delta-60 repeat domain-containing protein [Syntrophothermus sp.]